MPRTSTRPRRGSPHHLTPAFKLFKPSYRIVRKNIWIFGPLYIVPFIFAFHSWLWTPTGVNAANTSHWHRLLDIGPGWSSTPTSFFLSYAFVGFALIWALFVIAVGTVIQVMTQEAQLEASENGHLSFDTLLGVARVMTWRMFKLYVVAGLAIIFTLLIFTRRYFLSSYVMLDKKPTSILEAMRISDRMSRAHSGSVWGVVGVIFLIGLISIIPIVGWLASFFLGVAYSVAPALRYQELKQLG